MTWSSAFKATLAGGSITPLYYVREIVFGQWGGNWTASTYARTLGATTGIVGGSIRITGPRLNIATWTATGGSFSFDCPHLSQVLPHITRGSVLVLSMGFPGQAAQDFEDVAIGVVAQISGVAPVSVQCLDAMAIFRSRLTTDSSESDLFAGVTTTTTLGAAWSTGDSILAVASTSGFERNLSSSSETGALAITLDDGTIEFVYYDDVTSSVLFSGVNGGRLGSAGGDAAEGNLVEEVAIMIDHPIAIFQQVLLSTGNRAGGSTSLADEDVLPRTWGMGLPEEFAAINDMQVWQNATTPSGGGYNFEIGVAGPRSDGLNWLFGILKNGGFFPVVRQGQYSMRAAIDPAEDDPNIGITITDNDIEEGPRGVMYNAFHPSTPFEYTGLKVRSSASETPITHSSTQQVQAPPHLAEKIADLSAVLFPGTLTTGIEAATAVRLFPWAARVSEQVIINTAGLRLAELTVGDRPRLTTTRVAGRSESGSGGYDNRKTLVTGVSPDYDRGTVRVELAILPTHSAPLP